MQVVVLQPSEETANQNEGFLGEAEGSKQLRVGQVLKTRKGESA